MIEDGRKRFFFGNYAGLRAKERFFEIKEWFTAEKSYVCGAFPKQVWKKRFRPENYINN